MVATAWFDVDKKGLAQLMGGRSKAFILYELLQNAWDQNVTTVHVHLQREIGARETTIIVEDDDPEGFTDLVHAYTLFAESGKKGDAEKRGRFNLGEKLVLSLAREAEIQTTKGTIFFDSNGQRIKRAAVRDRGSLIRMVIPMTRDEHEEMELAVYNVICPSGIETKYNGGVLPRIDEVARFTTTLPTLIADDDGVMRQRIRQTPVYVYEPAPGEPATLFEMGIPVVETGDRYHVDVQQKVPLNMDRDNVTPAYLRAIRVAVLNVTHEALTAEDVAQTWVKEACSDERVSDAAVCKTVKLRFGERAVIYDPTDLEANKLAVADGRPLVYGGSLSGDEWSQVKRAGALQAAGVVTPSPKPYSPNGTPLKFIEPADQTPGMQHITRFARDVALRILKASITVGITSDITWPFAATYGPGRLVLNLGSLGHKFFDNGITNEVLDLLIHEFGHHYASDHLSSDYYDALTRLGARMTRLALDKPELFR